MGNELEEIYETPRASSVLSNESESLRSVGSLSSSEYHTPIMSQDSLEEEPVFGKIHPNVEREDRAKRKRELFDSIENDSKRLPPSKRSRKTNIIPLIPTDSEDRDIIKIQDKIQEKTDYQKDEPVTPVTIEQESSSTKKVEKLEEKNQPRRSSRKKNTVKLNKPIENDRLTPMGLPKPIRLGKNAEVSLEDIYMQKDYRTPKTTSALPTIIDENDPKVKKSGMTKQKRCRHIDFQTDPALRKPRKRPGSRANSRRNNLLKKNKRNSIESMELLKSKLAKLDEEMSQDEELPPSSFPT